VGGALPLLLNFDHEDFVVSDGHHRPDQTRQALHASLDDVALL
jgi:hypothetical protein